MHIITGLMIASLFGKKENSTPPFVRYTGPIITKHHIEGRIRFQIEKFKDNPPLIHSFLPEFQKIDGIKSCSANPITGSLVVHYDGSKISTHLLFSVLVRMLRLEEDMDKTPMSLIEKEIRTVGKSANRALLDKSHGLIDIKTALPLLFAILGIRKLYQEGIGTLPSGLILLWWTYQSLGKKH